MDFYTSYKGKLVHMQDFDTCIENLKNSYEYMQHYMESMKETLDNWNKDEEIQKYKDQVTYIRDHSLLQLSDKERDALHNFRLKHYEKCALPKHSKSIGNTYIYELTGTGLGCCIKITCPICGESEDVTDTSSW